MLAKGLREHTFAVDVAIDGEEAVFQASVNSYDLLILDVVLPFKTGFEVCRELRGTGLDIPILMLTARDGVQDRITGLDAGADDYLIKPFDFHELLARARALLRRGHALKPQIVTIADLAIDTRSHRVNRAGRPIDLTAKEYALLEYLARRAGEVVKRAEIAEHVWDDSYDPFSNLIEVYIRRLRQKIDEDFSPKLILTMRGDGYLLDAREAINNG
jgi:two-component system copper resistance phosphate regulon response regulator CusR